MNYKVLYRKYRPQTFDEIFEQQHTVKMLSNAIKNEKISHAYLFTGPRGTGKTSMAKIFARAINCLEPINGGPCNECDICKGFINNPDIIEIDAASNNGVDEIRELINNVKLVPSMSRYKVYIIDEVHMLTTSAFNALLLTLEEPPSHVVFILATTDVQNVPITILSRCQRFDFRKIGIKGLVGKLKFICQSENIKITEDALLEIAYIAEGGLRDAESILDQVVDYSKEKITLEDVSYSFGTVSKVVFERLFQVLNERDAKKFICIITEIADQGIDCSVFVLKFIDFLKEKLVEIFTENFEYVLNYDEIKAIIFELNECLLESKSGINPFLLVEVVLLKYCNSPENIKKGDMDITPPNLDSKSHQEILGVEDDFIDVLENENIKVNIDDFVYTRLNNCFVGARKETLTEIKGQWSEFLSFVKTDSAEMISLIIDSNVVVASDDYLLLIHKMESTANLINKKYVQLEILLSKFFESDYNVVAIASDAWIEEKKKYVEKIKNGVKYQMLDEVFFVKSDMADENIEELATQIFDDNCIEIQ